MLADLHLLLNPLNGAACPAPASAGRHLSLATPSRQGVAQCASQASVLKRPGSFGQTLAEQRPGTTNHVPFECFTVFGTIPRGGSRSERGKPGRPRPIAGTSQRM